jgi:hypothetical protein
MVEILWHRRETRRQTEKTKLNLKHWKKPVYSTAGAIALSLPGIDWPVSTHHEHSDNDLLIAQHVQIPIQRIGDLLGKHTAVHDRTCYSSYSITSTATLSTNFFSPSQQHENIDQKP